LPPHDISWSRPGGVICALF